MSLGGETVRMRGVERFALAGAALLVLAGCGGSKHVLELHGAVMYDKPEIISVSHVLTDRREQGGAAVVRVTLQGDPGLVATFDISPDIAKLEPMTETGEGTYAGDFSLPPSVFGGPYTIVGRLKHEDAGEMVRRDPEPLTITLLDRGP